MVLFKATGYLQVIKCKECEDVIRVTKETFKISIVEKKIFFIRFLLTTFTKTCTN